MRVWGLGFRVWGLGLRVEGLGFKVHSKPLSSISESVNPGALNKAVSRTWIANAVPGSARAPWTLQFTAIVESGAPNPQPS